MVKTELLKKLVAVAAALTLFASAAYAATERQRAEISERIKPAGQVCLVGDVDCGERVAAVDADEGIGMSGDAIYNQYCAACHNAGVAGAARLGDSDKWAGLLGDKGRDGLYETAIQGRGAMPPKGTCMNCSEDDLRATVDFMLEEADL